MCGIVGVVSNAPVNQLIYDALLLLQHRGQDAAGIVTQQERKFFMHKAKGMVRDVFRTRNMRGLPGNVGTHQYACILALGIFGVGEADALAYSLVLNTIQVATLIAQGLVALPFAGVSLSDFSRARAEIPSES